MSLTRTLLVCSDFPVLTALLLVICYYRKFDYRVRVFAVYIAFSAIIQLTALVLWFWKMNNMLLLHIHVPVGFCLLAWFYQSVLESLINKRIIATMVLLFFLFSLVNSVFFQPVHVFNSAALTVESILLIIISIFSFIVFLNQKPEGMSQPVRKSIGWINSGIFIYYSSTLLLFYFSNFVMEYYSVKISAYAWVFHAFSSIVMYCCFIIGLCKQIRVYR
ncbi:hypothetical protein SAMN05421788_108224 [Filimonas lacunae]|uniref:YhhN-like protein n=1 Tax=Filimonas lacunae TaxID=477680 RepID=A0A173MDW6_9BACT|nr:hypothetical protein [Filimonas lacunae]BAV05631.1 hypothetical protein FLA_1642 [Filimonas lacunae]SIT29127.1 hypothetical protein SAMN05421788_108224 [Filimonas lacunae]